MKMSDIEPKKKEKIIDFISKLDIKKASNFQRAILLYKEDKVYFFIGFLKVEDMKNFLVLSRMETKEYVNDILNEKHGILFVSEENTRSVFTHEFKLTKKEHLAFAWLNTNDMII